MLHMHASLGKIFWMLRLLFVYKRQKIFPLQEILDFWEWNPSLLNLSATYLKTERSTSYPQWRNVSWSDWQMVCWTLISRALELWLLFWISCLLQREVCVCARVCVRVSLWVCVCVHARVHVSVWETLRVCEREELGGDEGCWAWGSKLPSLSQSYDLRLS